MTWISSRINSNCQLHIWMLVLHYSFIIHILYIYKTKIIKNLFLTLMFDLSDCKETLTTSKGLTKIASVMPAHAPAIENVSGEGTGAPNWNIFLYCSNEKNWKN